MAVVCALTQAQNADRNPNHLFGRNTTVTLAHWSDLTNYQKSQTNIFVGKMQKVHGGWKLGAIVLGGPTAMAILSVYVAGLVERGLGPVMPPHSVSR
jgi:hypothetical protein